MASTSPDTFVEVAPDGTGKRIRNVALDVVQADGTVVTVYMQVVAIRDNEGQPVNLESTVSILGQIHEEIQALRVMYGRATGQAMIMPNRSREEEN